MKKINWHRLFGLMLMDYLSNRGFDVELEKDLSQKRQLLDVVIVERRSGEADISGICDGFDNLSQHNLLSYKSMQETLNVWAIEELIGHYVNYRKVLGKDRVKADEIRLYAVCTRHPKSILSLQGVTEANPGVYDILVLKRKIRIIVLSEIPIKKDFIMAHLGELDPEMRLKCLDPETRLKGLNPEIIEALSEEVEKTENELTLKKRRTRGLGAITERALFYWSKMCTSQIQSGDGFDGNAFDLLKIISNDKKTRMAYEAGKPIRGVSFTAAFIAVIPICCCSHPTIRACSLATGHPTL